MKYSLELNENELSIKLGAKEIFGGLTLRAYRDTMDAAAELELAGIQGNEAWFENGKSGFKAALRLENSGDSLVLRISGSYEPMNLPPEQRYAAHFSPDCAIAVDIARVPGVQTFVANYQRCEFWCRTKISPQADILPDRIQGLLMSCGEGFMYAVPPCDSIYRANLKGNPDGALTLYVRSNDLRNECKNTVALVMSAGKDPYVLVPKVTDTALRIMGKKGGLRNKRRYPDIFEYLGWCSWDAFHMDVTHDDMIKKAKELRDKEIPVRWFIFDDMWGDVPAINRATMHSRELRSFEADPVRFPKGLKACVRELKNDYDIISGIWHPTTGYWNGIEPGSELAKKHKDDLVRTLNNKLVHNPELLPAFNYYNAQHSFYRDCGAEFVKVDNQGFINQHYKNIMSIGEAASNLHTAVEASVGANFDGAMINCMCMPSENFWNRPTSSVCRFSGDFQPEDRQWFVKHLLQCSYNSLFQGCLYYGDWDMWWSDDAQAKKNAVLRAMSGGPVYMSDELNRSVKETIMPIVYSDGRIIRLNYLALPAPECLTEDAQTSGKPFKVFNRVDDYGVLAVFNLDCKERPVSGVIKPGDMELYSGEYVCYDWFAGKIVRPEFNLKLKDYDDFRLYIYVPASDGRAFIGLTDKYMSPATLTYIAPGCYRLREGGKLGIYSKKPIKTIKVDGERVPVAHVGNCLYSVELEGNDIVVSW